MNRIIFVLLVALSISHTYALAGYESSDFVQGEITLTDGTVINCYIEYHLPGVMQNGITYLNEPEYELLKKGERVKNKFYNKLKVKQVDKISLSNGRKFKTVKFADLTAVGAEALPKLYLF
ncbi:MAG: hypothetical protein MI922_14565, partial [Bacteroidales bacterium]|nr:hypothetical protein [Bacteroidales bacterium]